MKILMPLAALALMAMPASAEEEAPPPTKGELKLAKMLEGRVAGQQLGTTRDGKVEHRPGWDITFSAPKSVSIMAEVAGDKRLIAAHAAAVKAALGHVEQHMAATRVREGGEVRLHYANPTSVLMARNKAAPISRFLKPT